MATTELTRAEVESLSGPAVIEFGTSWCGYCRVVRPLIASTLSNHPEVPHIKIEDGKGRPLGRSFRVTLWPTLIFLKDGKEICRVVRPVNSGVVSDALEKIIDAR